MGLGIDPMQLRDAYLTSKSSPHPRRPRLSVDMRILRIPAMLTYSIILTHIQYHCI